MTNCVDRHASPAFIAEPKQIHAPHTDNHHIQPSETSSKNKKAQLMMLRRERWSILLPEQNCDEESVVETSPLSLEEFEGMQ